MKEKGIILRSAFAAKTLKGELRLVRLAAEITAPSGRHMLSGGFFPFMSFRIEEQGMVEFQRFHRGLLSCEPAFKELDSFGVKVSCKLLKKRSMESPGLRESAGGREIARAGEISKGVSSAAGVQRIASGRSCKRKQAFASPCLGGVGRSMKPGLPMACGKIVRDTPMETAAKYPHSVVSTRG